MRPILPRFDRSRGWWTVSVIAFFVVTAACACTAPSFGRGTRLDALQTPLLGPRATAVAPGIFLLGGLSPGAAYAVETSRGLILVDSGLNEDASILKSQLASLGLDWTQVRAVLLTHAHGDHCGGAEHLRTATGAKVYAGQGDAAVLKAGRPREAFFSNFYMPNEIPHATTVDVELKGDETLDFGDTRLLVLATPGHTPGSTCYLMERAGIRALFAGDVISRFAAIPDHTRPMDARSERIRSTCRPDFGAMPRPTWPPCEHSGHYRSLTSSCPAIPARRSYHKAPVQDNRRGKHCSTRASTTWKLCSLDSRPTEPISSMATPRSFCPIYTTWAISTARPSTGSSRRRSSSSWTLPAALAS